MGKFDDSCSDISNNGVGRLCDEETNASKQGSSYFVRRSLEGGELI
jgi:hypothetical protein